MSDAKTSVQIQHVEQALLRGDVPAAADYASKIDQVPQYHWNVLTRLVGNLDMDGNEATQGVYSHLDRLMAKGPRFAPHVPGMKIRGPVPD